MDFDAFEIAGIGGRAGFDDAQRAVGKFERGDGRVFDRDPLVGQQAGVGGHFAHRAHQPGEDVDAVNRLVHQRAAAVQLPRAAQAPLS